MVKKERHRGTEGISLCIFSALKLSCVKGMSPSDTTALQFIDGLPALHADQLSLLQLSSLQLSFFQLSLFQLSWFQLYDDDVASDI